MSDPLFVYGTLRYRPLLQVVLGQDSHLTLTEAVLPDHSVHWAAGESFPMIVERPGHTAPGLLIAGLTQADRERLDFYEAGFAYDRRRLDVAGQGAEVFFPAPGQWQPGEAWDLSEWVDRWGALTLRAAAEVMEAYGQATPAQIAWRFPMIRARAAAWVAAGQEPGTGAFTSGTVTVEKVKRPYTEYFSLQEYTLRHPLIGGGMSPPITRAAFLATDAAIVLPYDAARDRVLLVEQFRMGPFARGDRFPWSLEPVAGRVDAGETPEACAYRETVEEAGVTLTGLEAISRSYPSPGCSTEFFHIFLGHADLPDALARNGGMADEHEDIAVHLLSFDDLMARVDAMEAKHGPLVLAALWLCRNRDRLRAAA